MKKIKYILFIALLLFNGFSLENEKKIVFIDINQIFINSKASSEEDPIKTISFTIV